MLEKLPVPDDVSVFPARLAAILRDEKGWNPVRMRSRAELAGCAGLDLSERVSGLGWSPLRMVEIFRQFGRLDLELRDLVGAGHARLLTLATTRHFDPFLEKVARGDAYAAVAITEPEVGSDLQGLTTAATPTEGGYRLDGTKQHISRILECSHLIVFASVKRGGDDPRITAFLVPRDAPGVTVEPMAPMGMATVSWGRVHLRGVEIPTKNRVGGEGQGLTLFIRHFTYWRTMMAAAAVGSAQSAVEDAAERMKVRQAFGGPIGRFTHLQQGLALHIARLRMAWLLIERVADDFAAHRWPVADAAMAKAEGVEAAIEATEWAMSVFGAAGYDCAVGVEKRYRDLLGLRVADGTTDVLRGQVARAVLGERLYELSLNRGHPDGAGGDVPRRVFW